MRAGYSEAVIVCTEDLVDVLAVHDGAFDAETGVQQRPVEILHDLAHGLDVVALSLHYLLQHAVHVVLQLPALLCGQVRKRSWDRRCLAGCAHRPADHWQICERLQIAVWV